MAERDVKIRLIVEGANEAAFKKVGSGAQGAQQSIDKMGAAAKSAGSAVTQSLSSQDRQLKQIGTDWAAITGKVTSYGNAVKKATADTAKLGAAQKATGGGAGMLGGLGGLFKGAVLASEGASLLGMASGGAGLSDIRREDLGMVSGWAADLWNTASGRKFKERREDEFLERSTRNISADSALQSRQADLADQAFRLGQRPAESGADELRNMDEDRLRIAQRLQATQAQLASAQKEQGGSTAEQMVRQTRIKELLNQQLADQQKLLSVDQQRLSAAQALAKEVQGRMQSMEKEFAMMDPLKQQAAIEIGKKLKAGQQLTGVEQELASSIGPLQGLLQEKAVQQVQSSGLFEEFKQVGLSSEATQELEKLSKMGIDVNVSLDKQAIIDGVREGMGDIVRDMQMTVRDQSMNDRRSADLQDRHKRERSQVFR